ncbi:hypothetical protein DY052_05960 [Apilactobacillus timberlakei]|uniref:hypothetical protein n=1 Tax=Apilactobacillus timberlakei TaxID=2008380 RepID=UPI0011271F83|nr:hypothetical protein [Apilactobacillus timberlakei]TPR14968.1 hypothetical protein DY052_05960 [Apilactobacillus timberlakei]
MGHSAGYVNVKAVKNGSDVTDYNLQEEKISGKWINQNEKYVNQQLLTFYGSNQYKFDDLEQQGESFKREIKSNRTIKSFKMVFAASKNKHVNYSMKNNTNDAYTIIQSFDFNANPQLTPKEAHTMGSELYDGYKKYLKNNFNYDLSSGFIATHIDRDSIKAVTYNNKNKVLNAHLHNHIVIPAINSKGDSISNYLSRSNIMDLREINDRLVMKHNLNDFYLKKLSYELQPNQKLLEDKPHSPYNKDLKNAVERFHQANNQFNFKEISHDFDKTKKKRDAFLKEKYGYQTKQIKSSSNVASPYLKPQVRNVFTMNDFKLNKDKTPRYYNQSNLRTLSWNEQSQALAYKDLRSIKFDDVDLALQSPKDYQKTLQHSLFKNVDTTQSIKFVKESSSTEDNQKTVDDNPKTTKGKMANYLEELMQASQTPPPQFEFEVHKPLNYISEDFRKRMKTIQKEYAMLMRNEQIDEKERNIDDKVVYVKRNDEITKEQRKMVNDSTISSRNENGSHDHNTQKHKHDEKVNSERDNISTDTKSKSELQRKDINKKRKERVLKNHKRFENNPRNNMKF